MESNRNKGDALLDALHEQNALLNAANSQLHRIDKSTRGIRMSLLIILAIIVFSFIASLMLSISANSEAQRMQRILDSIYE